MKRSTKVRPTTTARPFRIGTRRRGTTATAARSEPTRPARRKHGGARPVESQGTTTKLPRVPDTRYRFVSRKPSRFHLTTSKPVVAFVEQTSDQTLQSSNQQEDYDGGDTTELAGLAQALKNLQQVSTLSVPVTVKQSSADVYRVNVPSRFINRARKNSTIAIVSKYSALEPFVVTTPSPKYTVTVSRAKSRYSTTVSPLAIFTTATPKKRKPQPFQKIKATKAESFQPLSAYDYYDDIQASILAKIPEHSKVLLHGNGVIECLDQGNFPHPISCKKFISCAKMENGKVLGWEYTCPKNLSFDPIGGICNWSAGLGCNE